MILMLAPGPNMTFGTLPSGASYTSDRYSIIKITNNSVDDQTALQEAGCYTLTPFGGWGSAIFTTVADLYAADAVDGLIMSGQVGFPRYMAATINDDGSNTGTWGKTGTGAGDGNWTQVSTTTFYNADAAITAANDAADRAEDAQAAAEAAADVAVAGVSPSTFAQARAGLNSTTSMTPARTYDAVQPTRERLSAYLAAARAGTTVPYTLNPRTELYAAACAATGTELTEARKNRHSRLMDRLDAVGARLYGAWCVGDTEAHSMINLVDAGTYDMTKGGAPTFTAQKSLKSGGSNANYYESTLTLGDLDKDDVCVGLFVSGVTRVSTVSSSASGWGCGALDGTNGMGILGRNSSTSNSTFRLFGPSITPVDTVSFNGKYFHCANRHPENAGKVELYHCGELIEEYAQASVAAVTGTTKIRWLSANGGANPANNEQSIFFVGKGMTRAQMAEVCAALEDFYRCVQYGDPMIYDKGVGPSEVRADVIVYGLTTGSIVAAYEAARLGWSVALVGDWLDETIWDLGGMQSSGLTRIDFKVDTALTAVYWQMLYWMKYRIWGTTSTGTNASSLSVESACWNWAFRRMLDPTRTDTTNGYLPGQNIKVYMTGGVDHVSKKTGPNGLDATTIHTRDGRTFYGRAFVEGAYDGDIIYYSGCDYSIGSEAAGTGQESDNGYQPTELLKPTDHNGVDLDVDPYVTPGDPTSGLIHRIEQLPALAEGALDPLGLQSCNYRLTLSDSLSRRAFFDLPGSPPPDYDPSNYEALARMLAASVASGGDYTMSDLLTLSSLYNYSNHVVDANAKGAFSTDPGGNGIEYAAAGTNVTARRGVVRDTLNYIRGMFYWLLYSGDSRIPATMLTQAQGWWLDAANHLDPGCDGKLWWPRQMYRRDAVYNLKRSDIVLDANDTNATDGTIPSKSVKTIAVGDYRTDRHLQRWVVAPDGYIAMQGQINGGGAGTDQICPIPLEAVVAEKEVCGNLAVIFAGSWTKQAHALLRMEPTTARIAVGLAHVIDYALKNGCALEDVDYATVAASLDALGSVYIRAPLRPVVN